MKTFEKWRSKEPSRIKSVISKILWKNIFHHVVCKSSQQTSGAKAKNNFLIHNSFIL